MTAKKKKKKFRPPVSLTCRVAWLLAKTIRLTCRIRKKGCFDVLDNDENFIVVCWHNRILLTGLFVANWFREPGICGIVSQSGDGDFAAEYGRLCGGDVVRGSSSKGGFRALLKLKKKLEEGVHVFITPDGPRGPMYHVHPGAVVLAAKTGRRILPICTNTASPYQLGSWDKTQIPRFFSSGEFIIGEPLTILPRDAQDDAKTGCEKVRKALLEITNDG